MSYKLVVLDMDGTLLDNNHQISNKNRSMIGKLMKEGVGIILASGRPYESIYPYIKDLGIDLPVIATNGAVIKSPVTNEVYYKSSVPLKLAKDILNYGERYHYTTSLYLEDEIVTSEPNMVKEHWELEKIEARLMKELKVEKEPTKIIYFSDHNKIQKAFRFLSSKYKKELYITCSGETYLDVMNVEASKGRALSYVMKKMNLSTHEVMVIGNNFNDLTMFEVAGLAVAMDNSPDEVKKMSSFVTKANIEDGVAWALEKFIPII